MGGEQMQGRVEQLANKAADHLESKVQKPVQDILIHFNVKDKVLVLEMETEPVATKSHDHEITHWWVITGAKLPTTFTPKEKSPGPKTVLAHYVAALKKWAEAVAAAQEPPDKLHFEVPRNPTYAKGLVKFLDSVEAKVLPSIKDLS